MSWEIHIDWRGDTVLVGFLHTAERSAAVSLEYSSEWLNRPGRFAVDPTSLPLRPGVHHSQALFGALHDCGPDRWGRLLIERAVRKQVLERKPYRDIDYMLALADATRLGALRFRADPRGPFLAPAVGKLPPIIQLQALLRASDAIHADTETAEDLRLLLGAGSPLGGARPKSALSLKDGRLALAKFPKPDDTRDIAAGEVLALTLARKAGIHVVEHQLVSVRHQSVAVITRFDRHGVVRVPFVSAATLLALPQGELGAYTLIGDAIHQFGHNVVSDLAELWRRLIFSLLANNYDDHPRNHGFLMVEPGRWALSPAYDLNPVPEIDRARVNKTPLSEEIHQPSISGTLEIAPRFGLKTAAAKAILREVFDAVATGRDTARALRIKSATVAAYESAFEHDLIEEARTLLKATS
jgi:serine/threonine-protein kinase HipA